MEVAITGPGRAAIKYLAGHVLQALTGALWALSLVLLAALAPIHVRDIGQDWQVESLVRALSGALPSEAVIRYALVLGLLGTATCLIASFIIAWRRPGHPLAALASIAFVTLPILLNLNGYTDSWPSPFPWDQTLGNLRIALSLLGLLALLGFAYLFPDGHFEPRWSVVPAGAALAGCAAAFVGPMLGIDAAAWAVGSVLVFGSFSASVAVQIVKLRRADAAQARVTRGVVAALGAMCGLLVVSFAVSFTDKLPGPEGLLHLLGLHAQPLAAVLLPVAVVWAAARRGLWEPSRDRYGSRVGSQRLASVAGATAVLLSLGIPFYAAARVPPPAPLLPLARPIPVIVDTDLSHDDILALSFLLRDPSVRVQAVLISGTGEVRCEAGIRNAQALVALAGKDGLPVACGRETPLAGSHSFPTAWRDSADAFYGVSIPAVSRAASAHAAPRLLLDTVNASPAKPVILTLGPLTNVAEALQTEPALASKLTAIFAMGGAVGVAGNIAASGEPIDNSTAEWNIWVDPRAANIVLSSGAPVVLVPLDATRSVPATMEFLDSLRDFRQTPLAELNYRLMLAREDFVRSGGYQFWDVLAASLLVREDLARYQESSIKVLEAEGPDSGRTVNANDGSRIRVAVWANREHFEKLLLETLNR